ncbi:Methyltransferase-like protein 2-A [Gracilariopsis chorda]|uniref:tRNA N(3)-methylcytidine methyltransferase n=1 Tax=Gracilariopsis chorda TaxID=448386 RepID=A0A2V3J6D3_9FLOR|nr:Methyltransferase-like protein 2-A [Gracilariopsis chorda]|eukprot:PXF49873.1 Methyltransferase-like protein 2-A [Gracilariopsis chorda]
MPKVMPRYGESRGARKRARAIATQARHEANADLASRLAKPPATAAEAAERWDAFYTTKPKLFKDRHVLRAAFPELVGPQAAADPSAHVPPLSPMTHPYTEAERPQCDQVLVEVGCGGGNAVYPVLRANSRLFAFAFDFSARAVELTKKSPEYREDRILAFQADATRPESYLDVVLHAYPKGAQHVTAFWTLSAIEPAEHGIAVKGLASLLAEDGWLFVRDYAVGDMRETRFAERGKQVDMSSEKLYLRGDGTYAYFFEQQEMRSLFERAGLVCVSCEYEDRIVTNRKSETTMKRRWIQAKFQKRER